VKVASVKIEKTKNEFPDIDSDFFDRDVIFDYLIKKYGQKHVAAVGTNTRYSAKNAIQDLGSVFEVPSADVFAVTKIYNPDINVEDNISKSDKIAQFFQSYPKIKELFPVFVDTIRGYGIHAGGIVITDTKYPIDRYFALQRTSEGSRIATLWDKGEVESVGGVKMDILGLNCCGQIHNVKKLVGLNPYTIHPQEEEVYKTIVMNLAHKNIFQFDTSLGKTAFSELLPLDLEQLSTASGIIRVVGTEEGRNAYEKYKENLKEYQTGNLHFWEAKLRDEVAGDFSFEVCRKVLKETFGVLVYQEQLIRLVQFLSRGKMTFQDGNRVRKALDKNIFGKYGTVDKLQGNRELLKKWHTDIMAIFNEYLLPFIEEDGFSSNRSDIQDFLHFRLDKHNHLPIPRDGILNWFIVVLISFQLYTVKLIVL
jgi:DNA polymerase-3 subunit alpha